MQFWSFVSSRFKSTEPQLVRLAFRAWKDHMNHVIALRIKFAKERPVRLRALELWASNALSGRTVEVKQLVFESLAAYRIRFQRIEAKISKWMGIRAVAQSRRAVQGWATVKRNVHSRGGKVKSIARALDLQFAPALTTLLSAWQQVRKDLETATKAHEAHARVISMTVVKLVRKEVRAKSACWRSWRLAARRVKLSALAHRKAMLWLAKESDALLGLVFRLWAELPREAVAGAAPAVSWDEILPKLLGHNSWRSNESRKQAVMFAWLGLLVQAGHAQQLQRKAVLKMSGTDCEGFMLAMIFRSWVRFGEVLKFEELQLKVAESEARLAKEKETVVAHLAARKTEESKKMAQERETFASEQAQHRAALDAEREKIVFDLAAEREKMASEHMAKLEAERERMAKQAIEERVKMALERKTMLEAEHFKVSTELAEQKAQLEDEREKIASEIEEHKAAIKAERAKLAAEATHEREKMSLQHRASLKAEREKIAVEAEEMRANMAAEHDARLESQQDHLETEIEGQKASLHADHKELVSQIADEQERMAAEVLQHREKLKSENKRTVAEFQAHKAQVAKDRRRGAVLLSVHALSDSQYGVSEEMCNGDLRLVTLAWKAVARTQRDKKVQVLKKLADDNATGMRLMLLCLLSTWVREAQNSRRHLEMIKSKSDGMLRFLLGTCINVIFGSWRESIREQKFQSAKDQLEQLNRSLIEEHQLLQMEVNKRTIRMKFALVTFNSLRVHLHAWTLLVRRRSQRAHAKQMYLKNVAAMTFICLGVCVREWKAGVRLRRHLDTRVGSFCIKMAMMGSSSLRLYVHAWKSIIKRLNQRGLIQRVCMMFLCSSMAGALNAFPVEDAFRPWAKRARQMKVAKNSALLFARHCSSNRRGLLLNLWHDAAVAQRLSREHMDARNYYITNLVQALFRRSCSEDTRMLRSFLLQWAINVLQPQAGALKTEVYRVSRLKSNVRKAVCMAIGHESKGCVKFAVSVWSMITILQRQVDTEMNRLVDHARRHKSDTAHRTLMLRLRVVDRDLEKMCTRSWRILARWKKRHLNRGDLFVLGSAIAGMATVFAAWRAYTSAVVTRREQEQLKQEALAWQAWAQKAAVAYKVAAAAGAPHTWPDALQTAFGIQDKEEDDEEVVEAPMGDSCDEGAIAARTPGSTPDSRRRPSTRRSSQLAFATPPRQTPLSSSHVSSCDGTAQPKGLRHQGRGRGGSKSQSNHRM